MIDQPPMPPAINEMLLPGDFARLVVIEARAQRKQRRNRNRIASAVACGALLIGLTFAFQSARTPASVASAAADSYVIQTRWDSNLEQLARAAAPDQPGDYLTPAAAWTAFDESDASVPATGFDWQG